MIHLLTLLLSGLLSAQPKTAAQFLEQARQLAEDGKPVLARNALERARSLVPAEGGEALKARGLLYHGGMLYQNGNKVKAREVVESALSLAEKVKEYYVIAEANRVLRQLDKAQGPGHAIIICVRGLPQNKFPTERSGSLLLLALAHRTGRRYFASGKPCAGCGQAREESTTRRHHPAESRRAAGSQK